MSLAGTSRGEGPPTMLLHGLGLCWQSWDPILPHLPDLAIHAIDLPGFGASPPLPGPVTVTGLLDALEDHLDRLDLSTAHLVGNSLGGLLAVGLAARGRARTVTAISPAGMAVGRDRLAARASILLSHALARAGRPLLPSVVATRSGRHLALRVGTAARPGDMPQEHALTIARNFANSTVVRATVDATERDDGSLLPYLGRVDVPVTVAWGSKDLLLRPHMGAQIKRAHPAVRLVRLPDCGHVPMSDDPVLVASVIRATVMSTEVGRTPC